MAPRGLEWSFPMIDRHMIGDIALAVLIALPTVAIARPEPLIHKDHVVRTPLVQSAVVAQRTPMTPRSSLLG
jgi:hypothetical protein